METKMLRLSEDKKTVTDEQGNAVYVAEEREGKLIYVPAATPKGKVCLEFKIEPKKVCISWNGPKCLSWGGIDVEVCAKWSND